MPLAPVDTAWSATKIIVIGAGLAGAALAYSLAQRGCEVTVLTQGGGASELPVGLLAAHLSAQDIELSQLSRVGVSLTLSHAQALLTEGLDWQPSVLEQRLLFYPEKNERLLRAAEKLPDWYEAADNAVLHKQAAWIKPQALARAWLKLPGITVRQAHVASFHAVQGQWQALDAQGGVIAEANSIVIAAGAQSGGLLAQCGHAQLMDNVSGSIAFGAWLEGWDAVGSQRLVNGNGSFLGSVMHENGARFWASGATYEREVYGSLQALQAASLEANQDRLAQLLPHELLAPINAQFAADQVQSWQGTRCTTSDRLPIVGKLDDGLYVCTAMGSRGLSFAALCAELLAQEITADNSEALISPEHRQLLSPHRKTLKVPS